MALRRIALVIETSRAYGRAMLAGISNFGRVHGPWSFFVQERRLEDNPPGWLSSFRGDGVIARCDNEAVLQAVESLGVPCVDVRGNLESAFPVVRCDDQLATEQAVNHLLDRGFSRLAFCGYDHVKYSARRLRWFNERVESLGIEASVYESPLPFPNATPTDVERSHVLFEPGLAAWLAGLTKPVGIVACNDIRGQQLLSTCRECDILVPEHAAVVGFNNDSALCEISDPPLSSVELDACRVGYRAAEVLESMINGETIRESCVFVPPTGVVLRESTDVVAIDDPQVADAVRYIRLNAATGISVGDVVGQVPLSRRTLERRVKDSVGASVNQLIIQHQLAQVKKLLCETDWPLKNIAARSGFRHCEYLSALFKRIEGVTPGQYRRQASATLMEPPSSKLKQDGAANIAASS